MRPGLNVLLFGISVLASVALYFASGGKVFFFALPLVFLPLFFRRSR